jgi:hypothetical protein
MPGVAQDSEDDFLVVEDLDMGDESRLRELVAEIEKLLASPGKALRVSVLTSEQWKTVVARILSRHLRSGMERHLYTLRDPKDPQHLLVSPSAIQGINEESPLIYQDLVYAVLRCVPTTLNETLRHGVDDALAEEISSRIGVEFFSRNYPEERELVSNMSAVLTHQFGYSPLEWKVELRRSPDKVLLALAKSAFAPFWSDYIKKSAGQKVNPTSLAKQLATTEEGSLLFLSTRSALAQFVGERI